MRRFLVVGAGLWVACFPMSLGPGQQPWTPLPEPAHFRPLIGREPCANHDDRRQVYFGDLHVHTSYSMDANVNGLRSTPDDAYRFARGEEIGLPPYDAQGLSLRRVRLERPLDFAAVTDHAEWLAETSLCTSPGSVSYESHGCRVFRGEARSWVPGFEGLAARMLGIASIGSRPDDVCGPDARWCRSQLTAVWQSTQDAAERHYDRTSTCRFTTFDAWEYSASPGRSKVHRNIILRNEIVPELPISWLDEPEPEGLWRRLKDLCIDSGSGCDALAIPHNPNLSNGRSFAVGYRGLPLAEQRAQAQLRSDLEPLLEIMQVKGESECRNGMYGVVGAADELCDFEKFRGLSPGPEDCGEGIGSGATEGRGCVSRLDYARYAILQGLREDERIGVNPYRVGFIGSTDTHNGTPGDVEEYSYEGNDASDDASPRQRLDLTPSFAGAAQIERNPGGLMGVWAEENSRDSLFDAMRRREAFATSGPRIVPRFFGGWNYPADLCAAGDLVERGYADGVAMGGELPTPPEAAGGPVFVVSALRDSGTPEHPGTQLQRIQIIKGWTDPDGLFHQAVYDVAGSAENGADVDPDTCLPRGAGADALCGVWRDPEFDASRRAVYYARIVENPSCRWQTLQCLELPADAQPPGCNDPRVPHVIQERAWTSPIWYTPS